MTAVDAVPAQAAASRPRPVWAVTLLALREGWRMLRWPVYPLVITFFFVTIAFEEGQLGGRADVSHLLGLVLVYGALATLFAASLVATSARRSGAESQFASAALDPQLRTLATGLGVLVGPAAVAAVLTLALAYVQHGAGSQLADVLHGWEYAQLPLIWLGAGLLGVAAARWLPWPGVPLALFLGLIAWTLVSAQQLDLGRAVGFLMPFVISSRDTIGLGVESAEGQLGWHTVYLLGLCLLALAAALLRHRQLPGRVVFTFCATALLVTISAAWMQLP